MTPTHCLPRPRGGHCLWRQQAPGSHPHTGPGIASFPGSWPTLGPASPHILRRKVAAVASRRTGGPQRVPALGSGLLGPVAWMTPCLPGPTGAAVPWLGWGQGRPEGSGKRSAWGVGPRAPSGGLHPRARHRTEGLAGSQWVTCGPCVATTSGKVTSSPSSLSQAEVRRGSRRFLQLRNPPAWSRTPTGAGASRGLKWCAAVNRSVSECTRVGTYVPCLSG